jgi:ParB-like chromosome segregation protein Spo0J
MTHTEIREIEIGQIDLRYEHTRIHKPQRVSSLASAIKRCGQIIPVITVKEDDLPFVLMDGYLRIAALKRCGKDTVMAEIWRCKEAEALVQVFMRTQERRWEALEQAYMIKELQERHQLSQGKIAALMGKDKSWVSRRVSLLQVLSDDILQMVRMGQVSTWAATRVLAPLARANPDHATTLTASLLKEQISTRDLAAFFKHYQKANRRQRDNMILNPRLFFKALHAKNEDEETRWLKGGPEGNWVKDLKMTGHILRRLIQQVPVVIYKGQSHLDRRIVMTAFEDARGLMLSLEKKIRRLDTNEESRNQTDHSDPVRSGEHNPTGQSDAPCLQEHDPSDREGRDNRVVVETFPLRGGQASYTGLVQTLSGECGSCSGSSKGYIQPHGPLQHPHPVDERVGAQGG